MIVFETCSFKQSEKPIPMVNEPVFWKSQICTSEIYKHMYPCRKEWSIGLLLTSRER